MSMNIFKKSCLSGLVAISFVLVGISGVLMLFHVRIGAMTVLHEWIGLLFVLAGVLHLILNWKIFAKYCKQRSVIITIISVAILGAALMLSGGDHDSHGGHRHKGDRDKVAELSSND